MNYRDEAPIPYHGCLGCKHFTPPCVEYGNELPPECAVAAQEWLNGEMTEDASIRYGWKLRTLALHNACPYKEAKYA